MELWIIVVNVCQQEGDKMCKWIAVSDRLPSHGLTVIAAFGREYPDKARLVFFSRNNRGEDAWFGEDWRPTDKWPSHWMRIPDLPKNDN